MRIRTVGRACGAASIALVLATPAVAIRFYDLEPANSARLTAPPVPLEVGAAVVIEGSLTAGDVDYYAVHLHSGEVLSANTSGMEDLPSSFLTPMMRIGVFEPMVDAPMLENGAASSDNLTNMGGTALRFRAPGDTTVLFAVTGYDDAGYTGSHSLSGAYLLVLSRASAAPGAPDEIDPLDDDPAGAMPLDLAGVDAVRLHGLLREGPYTDCDFFALDLSAGDVVTAQTTPLGNLFETPDTRLGILTVSRNVRIDNDDAGNDYPLGNVFGSRVAYRAEYTGTYYVTVCYFLDVYWEGMPVLDDYTDYAGDYALTVGRIAASATPDGDSDPANDSRAGADALTLDASRSTTVVAELAELGEGSDVDFFALTLATGDVVSAALTPLSESLDAPAVRLSFFDGAGIALVEDPLAAPTLRARIDEGGTYYLGVATDTDPNYDGTGIGSGLYALTVGIQSALDLGPVTLDTDPVNDVRTGADAVALGAGQAQLVEASRVPGYDVDFYSVTLEADQVLTAMTLPRHGVLAVPDTLLGVFDDTGTLLVENDNNGSDYPHGREQGSLTRFYAASAGSYYVAVAHSLDASYDGSGLDEPGTYALTLAVADLGMIFVDGFESGDTDCWVAPTP